MSSTPHFIVPKRNIQVWNNEISREVSHNNKNILIVRNIALNIENNNNRKCGQLKATVQENVKMRVL